MLDYPLTEADAERILQLPKRIDTEPQWQQNEYGDWIMRVPVLADEQVPLKWYARFNPRPGNYTSILFWQRINLRRLDVGKLQHNPDCQNVGRMHKHRWTDAARNHVAYEPAEMARNDEVMTTLQKFLADAGSPCGLPCATRLLHIKETLGYELPDPTRYHAPGTAIDLYLRRG